MGRSGTMSLLLRFPNGSLAIAEGYFAWALQHEIDHLDGILYVDRLDRPEDLREIRPDDSAGEAVLVE